MSATESAASQLLKKLLEGVAKHGASDLHLRVGQVPYVRLDGKLAETKAKPLTDVMMDEILQLTSGIRPSEDMNGEFEFSFDAPDVARFRGHAFRDSNGWSLSLRAIPYEIPDFRQLRLPPVAKVLSEPIAGLVLVTGPTNSGKSTTVASMLHHLCSSEIVNLVTIEDPVEYRISGTPSCVSQREVGRHTDSWHSALAAVLRENPDVIFIGEIRDRDTLDVAMRAAETGHTVFTTFHTATAVQTVQRIIGMYPAEEQETARARLADALRGVLCQRLLPRKGTRGRILASEVMMGTFSIKEAIRDPARTRTIPAILERSGDQHMRTLDQSLAELCSQGLVEMQVALAHAVSPNDLKRGLSLSGMVA
ncbi:MAG: PilT/PilU family type 4a pilus ATPase [Deltaproteobacteria bacterium]|nr:MAG: PilT/PilU family type 4a pilus ATPase [Deltaproteobacteria bacterium]